MASSGKRKTTFAKLARESRLRERRLEKQARKDARKRASQDQTTEIGDPFAFEGIRNAPASEEVAESPGAEEG